MSNPSAEWCGGSSVWSCGTRSLWMQSNGPRVTMLTPDRDQIDRRILLQAGSLTMAGCQVTILGLPSLRGAQWLPSGVKLVQVSTQTSRETAAIFTLRRSYQQLQARTALAPTRSSLGAADSCAAG